MVKFFCSMCCYSTISAWLATVGAIIAGLTVFTAATELGGGADVLFLLLLAAAMSFAYSFSSSCF